MSQVGAMTRNRTNQRRPVIHSSGTKKLAEQIAIIRRRRPDLDLTIESIQSGDDRLLRPLINRAQHRDPDAALLAVWALRPRLAAVVIARHPAHGWNHAMDEYLTLAYLTILDVDLENTATFLADRIIARTRRRYYRSQRADRAAPCTPGALEAIAPLDETIDDAVLANDELTRIFAAVRDGAIAPAAWHTLLSVRVSGPRGTATARERKAASRAARRLSDWIGHAA
jgi:hypothetical protein